MKKLPLSLVTLTVATAFGLQAATVFEARAAAGETPARAGSDAVQGSFEVAQSLFVIEQLEEIYQVPQQAKVYPAPDEGSETIEIIPGNSAVRVTGRITGTEWYAGLDQQPGGRLHDGRPRFGRRPRDSRSAGGAAPARRGLNPARRSGRKSPP